MKEVNKNIYVDNKDKKLNISDVSDLLLLDKLKKIDKISRKIGGYYTRFGLPLDSEERMMKHRKEILQMIKVLKQ